MSSNSRDDQGIHYHYHFYGPGAPQQPGAPQPGEAGAQPGNPGGFPGGFGAPGGGGPFAAGPGAAAPHQHPSADSFIKGLLVGAGAAYLLTNETAQRTILRTAVQLWSVAQGGFEELKERLHDAEAEVAAADADETRETADDGSVQADPVAPSPAVGEDTLNIAAGNDGDTITVNHSGETDHTVEHLSPQRYPRTVS